MSFFKNTVYSLSFALVGCRSVATLQPLSVEPGIEERSPYEAFSSEYMIASQGDATTRAAREMFEKGGNIVDAAVAASFAIAVERPQSTGIGGGGFMMLHWAKTGEVIAVDFREQAPRKSTEKMYQDSKGNVIPGKSTDGVLASAVPGMVAGVLTAHKKYGTLDLQTVMAPAILLAEQGVRVYPHLAEAIQSKKEILSLYPASRALFFNEGKEPYKVGDILKQPGLAKTLKEIAKRGADGFYKGWVAKALVEEHHRLQGLVTQLDLDLYKVKFRAPVKGSYKGYEIYSMPPPSSGGIHIIEILNILEKDSLKVWGAYSTEAIHLTASAMQSAYLDRSKYLGDPDFTKVPSGLTSKSYAESVRSLIKKDRARTSDTVKEINPTAYESRETTHFTIADREGNIIASTQTINGELGAGVVVPQAGFVMNNEMDDFSSKPGVPNKFGVTGGKENAIAAGKRPLSSMSPTIVKKGGKAVLGLGSPSGSQIITCVVLTMLNYLEYGMPLFQAVASLRYHHQWLPDEIQVEEPGFSTETDTQLMKMGYRIKRGGIGCKVQAIALEKEGLHGVSDPRGEGLAAGKTPPHPSK